MPEFAPEFFAERRNQVIKHLKPNSLAFFPAASEKINSYDEEYPFRQDNDFLYLTGFEEPNAVAVLVKESCGNTKFILFNQPDNAEERVWNGARLGQEDAKTKLHVDEAYSIEELDQYMPKLIAGKKRIYCVFHNNGEKPENYPWSKLNSWRSKIYNQFSSEPTKYIDIAPLLHQMRLIKTDAELELMRSSIDTSAKAHIELMQMCQPGMQEYQLAATFEYYCKALGCEGLAYSTIVASGKNGCTLHYVKNNSTLLAGELLLVDAGAKLHGYCADITRTYPVNGKFSTDQAAIYQLVLNAQQAGIKAVAPGVKFNAIQTAILQELVPGLVKLGILSGDPDQLIADKAYLPFYMHRSGHWLGLDTHDAGKYTVNGEFIELQPNMVFTIEPGIYIAPDNTNVAEHWRGIAVRIEDDILVTSTGCEVLSTLVPKTIEEIEKLMTSVSINNLMATRYNLTTPLLDMMNNGKTPTLPISSKPQDETSDMPPMNTNGCQARPEFQNI